jgi:hypothetical protein
MLRRGTGGGCQRQGKQIGNAKASKEQAKEVERREAGQPEQWKSNDDDAKSDQQ